jgi:hypothetical protein
MANPPSYPADPNLSIHRPPPSVSLNGSVAFTPRSVSVADDSDSDDIPTPILSPRGGPQYEDLPPSYDEAQHQAVNDARNGLTPLDPNQLEAHRLTLNEGPNEPEIWEYRVRGEEQDASTENERAPEYDGHTNPMGATVPIQHNGGSQTIPVGRIGRNDAPAYTAPDPTAALLDRALSFTRQASNSDTQYAPRHMRPIAIPQQTVSASEATRSEHEPVQFLRAYAKALQGHSIRPTEFTEFLDGLNAVCASASMTSSELLTMDSTSSLVQDYIRGANEAFFMPRGLRVSLRSSSSLIAAITIPADRGGRAAAMASIIDQSSTAERRAQALNPWIEALETNVHAPSAQSLALREMGDRIRKESEASGAMRLSQSDYPPEKGVHESRGEIDEDPPHSIPEGPTHPGSAPREYWDPNRGGDGRRGQRGGPWTPFGAGVHGPFGTGNGPLRPPSNGPFGPPGHGPFGASGRWSAGPRMVQPTNELKILGSKDLAIAKWGEEFGRRMGDLGQQIGKQADAWGHDVGRRAAAWGEDVSARASESVNRSNPMGMPADNAMPPSYSESSMDQETGVLRGDSKSDVHKSISGQQPDYTNVAKKDDESLTSDPSDSESDFDSDSNDEDLPDTQSIFLKRVKSINKQAELAKSKGKNSPEEIAQERALAIEAAQNEKIATDLKNEEKLSSRTTNRELRQKRRHLKKQHRQKQRELRAAHGSKGKGKAKKTPEWKQAKREYRTKKKELRHEKMRIKMDLKDARLKKKMRGGGEWDMMDGMVWVLIENLDD